MDIPSPDDIRAMHLRHAPHEDAFRLVFTHCEIVWEVAERLLSGSGADVDPDLVRAGCLLHDIGVYRLYDDQGTFDGRNYIRHGVLGHEILEAEGLPEELRRFCSHHTGVGLTTEDVLTQRLPLPPADYLAETPEERLVMYADKFHSKSTPPKFLTPETYALAVRRFGEEKAEAFTALRALFGDPELKDLAAAHGHALT